MSDLFPSSLVCTNGKISFSCWVVFHYTYILYICVYISHIFFLYPFICWWILRLLPTLSYCKECCFERWGCMYLFKLVFAFPLGIYPAVELLDRTVVLVFVFWEPPYCFPQWLYPLTFLPTACGGSLFPTSWPPLVICGLFSFFSWKIVILLIHLSRKIMRLCLYLCYIYFFNFNLFILIRG